MFDTCILACQEGFYGYRCQTRCGFCLNKTVCAGVTGKCDEGCDPGYQGEDCGQGVCGVCVYIEGYRQNS